MVLEKVSLEPPMVELTVGGEWEVKVWLDETEEWGVVQEGKTTKINENTWWKMFWKLVGPEKRW
jgi:hypothetical protein